MALKIKSVDFHVTENARNHFTDRFEMVHMEPAIPVIRRGQKFSFTIAFEDRDYNKDVDEIKFIFSTGGSSGYRCNKTLFKLIWSGRSMYILLTKIIKSCEQF